MTSEDGVHPGFLRIFTVARCTPLSLRFSKILLKVINCFRSDEGAEFFADVRSVIETGRRQGLTAFEAIRKTLDGESLFATG